jgi:hypothetical protein
VRIAGGLGLLYLAGADGLSWGIRWYEPVIGLPAEHIELNLVRQLTTPEVEELAPHVTQLRYRVLRR